MQNPDLKLPQNLMDGRAWIETITLLKKNPKKPKKPNKAKPTQEESKQTHHTLVIQFTN